MLLQRQDGLGKKKQQQLRARSPSQPWCRHRLGAAQRDGRGASKAEVPTGSGQKAGGALWAASVMIPEKLHFIINQGDTRKSHDKVPFHTRGRCRKRPLRGRVTADGPPSAGGRARQSLHVGIAQGGPGPTTPRPQRAAQESSCRGVPQAPGPESQSTVSQGLLARADGQSVVLDSRMNHRLVGAGVNSPQASAGPAPKHDRE